MIETLPLPKKVITSVQELRSFFKDSALPSTEEEAVSIMEKAPEGWRDYTILFPRVIVTLPGESGASSVAPKFMLAYKWNKQNNSWTTEYLLTDQNAWGRTRPSHVDPNTTIIVMKKS